LIRRVQNLHPSHPDMSQSNNQQHSEEDFHDDDNHYHWGESDDHGGKEASGPSTGQVNAAFACVGFIMWIVACGLLASNSSSTSNKSAVNASVAAISFYIIAAFLKIITIFTAASPGAENGGDGNESDSASSTSFGSATFWVQIIPVAGFISLLIWAASILKQREENIINGNINNEKFQTFMNLYFLPFLLFFGGIIWSMYLENDKKDVFLVKSSLDTFVFSLTLMITWMLWKVVVQNTIPYT